MVLLVGLVFAIISSGSDSATPGTKQMFGKSVYESIEGAARVDAYRINGVGAFNYRGNPPDGCIELLGGELGYYAVDHVGTLTEDQTRWAVSLVLNSAFHGPRPDCIFEPEYGLKFTGPNTNGYVFLSVDCSMLRINSEQDVVHDSGIPAVARGQWQELLGEVYHAVD
ncbi:MAG: hypothetical protein R3D98_15175 [Candidatus Krumholzibacteriia bacterium]